MHFWVDGGAGPFWIQKECRGTALQRDQARL
jgi:hypothetical protein